MGSALKYTVEIAKLFPPVDNESSETRVTLLRISISAFSCHYCSAEWSEIILIDYAKLQAR